MDETIDWRPEHGYQYRCTLHKLDYDYAYWNRLDEENGEYGEEKYWGNPINDSYMNYRYPPEIKYLKKIKK